MMRLRCIVIDDEQSAQEVLKAYITRSDWLILEGVFDDVLDALNYLIRNKIDLIFLDTHMPEISEIDFLKTLKHPPSVIITSAHTEYAIDTFEFNALDYLKKPFSFERFLKSINRVLLQQEHLCRGINNESEFRFFNVNKTRVKVCLSDILYIESMREYTSIHTSKSKITSKIGITEIEKLLNNNFARIHRSFIVNLSKVSAFNAEDVFVNEVPVPIGISYKKQVELIFKNQMV